MHPPNIPITTGSPISISHLDEFKGLWKEIAKGYHEARGQRRGAYHVRKTGWPDKKGNH